MNSLTVPGNYQTAFRVFSTAGTLASLTSIVNLLHILLTTNPGDTVRNDYLDSMIQYFLLSGVGFAFSLGMGYAATFIPPVSQIPEFFRMIITGLLGVAVEYKAGGDPSLTGFGLGFLFSGIGAVSTLWSPGSLNAARLTNWVLLFFNLVLALIFGAIRYL
ncbi:MAG: hypothetical protein HeimC2_21220 [Candidatus Heimdallarchaeota archaeon LC_2]|nr:MAG: hypothetical protein HeimC2_21210 [Candidatus Heimdallarchaeota archaeon LC_2]OLS24816.1 MAG: hypothetical protein HeimC2_21220 [Candidatus Heimdallarchaeota archaeon LC_2]